MRTMPTLVERFDAVRITCDRDNVAKRVNNDERIHAIERVDCCRRAPRLASCENSFGVTRGVDGTSGGRELRHDICDVVDLAVIDNRGTGPSIREWLRSVFTINDCKAIAPKCSVSEPRYVGRLIATTSHHLEHFPDEALLRISN